MSSTKYTSANPTFRHAASAGVGVFGGATPAAKAAARQVPDPDSALAVPTSLRTSRFPYLDTTLTVDIMTGQTASLDFCRNGLRFRLTRRGDGKVHSWTEQKIHANGATEDRALSREETQYALALAAAEMDPGGNRAHRDLLTDFQRLMPTDAFPPCKAHTARSQPDLQKPDLFMFNRGHYQYSIGIAEPHVFTATYQLHTGMSRTRPMTPEERIFACQVISRELPINDNLIYRSLLDRLKEANRPPAPATNPAAP
jgi:hypothetical protein